ncbi:amidohydrolase family protein [Fulvivirga sp. 29W222]|uniref:Amidohydrolase family protein n=1 Tax=Fulvivirga marina TaxID=2494733 RepID=A0A937FTG1_9BACT|nr:amidohydrolase family protein [Fulvivirga marina]MBL6445329.1 amidohydrolase family protein [Fulvivirga marina]
MTGLKLALMHRALLVLFLGACYITSLGQSDDLDPVTRIYAIKNAHIIQAPGRIIDNGMLVIKNGIITAVGQNIDIPAGARVIQADSMYVYAGFIDGLSHAGVPKPKEEDKKNKVKDPGNPPNNIAGIEPQRDVRDMLDPNDKSVDEIRRLGFTVSHTVPYGRMLPGKGAIILLSGDNPDAMVYKQQASLYSQLAGTPGVYPNTIIGVMAKYRELYRQAEQAKAYKSLYAQGANGMERPASDRILEAFYPVIAKQIPVAFKAEDVLSIQRVLDLRSQLGFNLVLADVKQGWDIFDKLKSSDIKLFLSLDLPEMEGQGKSDTIKVDKKEPLKLEADLEKKRLQARKDEVIKKHYQQPALFSSKGVLFGFSTAEAKSKDIKTNLSKLVENGLSEEAALAALTTSPANLFGLEATMGTLDKGKIANLVISDKSYFNKDSKVIYVFIDGKMFEYRDKPKTKKAAKVIGKWTYSVEGFQGVNTGDIVIKGEEGNYSGTISSVVTGDTNDLSAISVNGNQLSFSFTVVFEGSAIEVDIIVTIDENTFEGTMTPGEYGSFSIEGEKVPEK